MHLIAIQSAMWFDFDRDLANPLPALLRIKNAGFEAIDLNIDHLAPSKAFAKQESGWQSLLASPLPSILEAFTPLKEALAQSGIKVCQMHAPFPVWHEGKEELNEYIQVCTENAIRVASFLSCPAIVIHGVKIEDKMREWDLNLPLFRRFGRVGAECNVKLCHENLFLCKNAHTYEGVCAEAQEAVRYVDTLNAEFGRDLFGFCFDVGHANLLGKNIRHFLSTLGPRLTCLHIHDNDGKDDLHLAPFTVAPSGGLNTDWESLIAGLRDIDYRGEISFETFRALRVTPPPLWDSLLCHIAHIGAYLKQRIEE